MRIVLDAMGSDDCPEPELKASVEAVREFGDEIILVGPEDLLKPRLEAMSATRVRLVNASEVITMEDKGMALALKAKRPNSKTSMAVGIDLVKSGEADAFVTAGNTGGAMATAFFRLGTLPGVERAALAGTFPVKNGYCIVLDIGANPDCKPEQLVQFAIMGSVYSRNIRGVSNPRVGLISNGEEGGKGNELIKATYPLLKESALNFVGNVEGKEVFGGSVDVVVCDGFTGNILLKSTEAVARLVAEMIGDEIKHSKDPRVLVGGLLVKKTLKNAIKQKLDPDEIGAAPLLGINGLVYIGHGRSNARAVVSAIRTARQGVQARLTESISSAISAQLEKIAKVTA